jgi:DNA-binding MarR family transcriptional regulator
MATPSPLGPEIKQVRPFRNPAEEATLGIVRTTSLIRRAVAVIVEQAGITPAQYNVLRILRGAGTAGLPTLAVRDRLIEEAPGITRLLDKLELAGFVRRERATPDRRQVICFITPHGLALLKKLDPIITQADETGGAGLTVAEQKTLIKLLDKVRGALRTTLTDPP